MAKHQRWLRGMVALLVLATASFLFPQTPEKEFQRALSLYSNPKLFRQKLREIQERFPNSVKALQAILLEAQLDVREGKRKDAISRLDVARNFPLSSLTESKEKSFASFLKGYAGYMMAHQLEAEGDRERARLVFKEVQREMAGRKERLPDGSTLEELSAFQFALSFLRGGDKARAKLELQEFQKQYPESYLSVRAQEILDFVIDKRVGRKERGWWEYHLVKGKGCGPKALKRALEELGIRKGEGELASLAGTNGEGTSLLGLLKAARKVGVKGARAVWWEGDLRELPTPFIAFTRPRHFVTVLSVKNKISWFFDPIRKRWETDSVTVRIFDPFDGKEKEVAGKQFLSEWGYGFKGEGLMLVEGGKVRVGFTGILGLLVLMALISLFPSKIKGKSSIFIILALSTWWISPALSYQKNQVDRKGYKEMGVEVAKVLWGAYTCVIDESCIDPVVCCTQGPPSGPPPEGGSPPPWGGGDCPSGGGSSGGQGGGCGATNIGACPIKTFSINPTPQTIKVPTPGEGGEEEVTGTPYPSCPCEGGDNANTGNGNNNQTFPIFPIKGINLPVVVAFKSDSMNLNSSLRQAAISVSGIGGRWFLNYQMPLVYNASANFITVMTGDGKELRFNFGYMDFSTGEQVFLAPQGYAKLQVRRKPYNGSVKFIIRDSFGQPSFTYYYNSSPNGVIVYLSSIEDLSGNRVEILRDGSGKITKIVSQNGQEIVFTYNPNGKLTQIQTPSGTISVSMTEQQLDATIKQLTLSLTDPSGSVWKVKHVLVQQPDGSYRMSQSQWQDPTNRTKTATFDPSSDRISGYTAANNLPQTYSYQYDQTTSTFKTTITYQDGLTVQHFHDSQGRLVKVLTQVDGTTSLVENRQYDSDNRLTSLTDPNGNTTSFQYDALGNITKITYPDGTFVTYNYDTTNRRIIMTDQLGYQWIQEFDSQGRLTKRVDPLGNVWQYQYGDVVDGTGMVVAKGVLVKEIDPLLYETTYTYGTEGGGKGRVVKITDPMGNTREYGYDAAGRVVWEKDARGNTTYYSYDANGRVTQITHPDGTFRTFTYDCCYLLSETDENGNTTSYTYDEMGRLIKITDPMGNARQFGYDSKGRKISETDALGRVTKFSYDGADRLVSVTYPDNTTWSYLYDGNGNKVAEIDPMGNQRKFYYDSQNRLVRVSFVPSGGSEQVKETRSYDGAGRLLSVSDAQNHTTSYNYDAAGRLVKTTDPMGNITEQSYDGKGQVVQRKDALGNIWRYNYDGAGRLVAETDPLGNTTQYGYDGNGNRTSVTDPLGNTTVYTYDARNRLIKVTDPLGNATQYAYDAVGNKIREISPTGRVTEFGYDANNRLVQVIVDVGGLNLTTSYQYDAVGNKIAETDAKGRTTQYVYDVRDRLVKVIDPQNGASKPTVYEYDALGRKIKVTDPEGRVVQYEYDGEGHLVKLKRGDGTEERYVYDPCGNMVQKIKADGRVINYSYDAAHRLVKRSYQDGTVHSFRYDALGRRVQMSDTTGTVSWQYDALGRVISVTQPVGSTTKTLQYSYDAAGRRVQMVDGEGLVTSYSYDAAGRLVQVSNALMGTTKLFYDGEGKLIRQENGNGTYATFSYDGAGRLVQIEYRRTSDNGLLSRFVYSYDAAGNKVQVQEEVLQPDGSWSVATVSYGYDQIDRLTSEKRTGSNAYWYEYAYDGSGNRLGMVERDGTGNIVGQKSYSYDSGNKLLQEVANGVTTVYQYDPNGNTISKATGTSQVRYYWDDEDKMVRVEDSVVMNFKVDGLGFRKFKEVVGQYQRWFVYDLGASEVPGLAPLVAEYDESGNLVAKYHYDGGGLIAMTRNNQSYWYGFEGIGTVRQLMGSQGQVVDAYAFDAWGNEITSPQSQVQNPFKYVGKHGYYLDTESALMLLGVRYYEMSVGRFMNLDPNQEGINWYLYAAGNPNSKIDPTGEAAVSGQLTCSEVEKCLRNDPRGNNCRCPNKGAKDIATALCVFYLESRLYPIGGSRDNYGGIGQLTCSAIQQLCDWGCNRGIRCSNRGKRCKHPCGDSKPLVWVSGQPVDLSRDWCILAQMAYNYLQCVGLNRYGPPYTEEQKRKIAKCADCVNQKTDKELKGDCIKCGKRYIGE
jgi:RHS repeat-associated protein